MTTLEKIRAEIEQNAYPIVHGVNNHEKGMTLYGILQVLDKYAEQEPKTGHWKFVCQHWRKCSECGFSHKFAEDWNYCPNCGAKMESEVNNG